MSILFSKYRFQTNFQCTYCVFSILFSKYWFQTNFLCTYCVFSKYQQNIILEIHFQVWHNFTLLGKLVVGVNLDKYINVRCYYYYRYISVNWHEQGNKTVWKERKYSRWKLIFSQLLFLWGTYPLMNVNLLCYLGYST